MHDEQQLEPVKKDDRTWAMLCHLSALSGFYCAIRLCNWAVNCVVNKKR